MDTLEIPNQSSPSDTSPDRSRSHSAGHITTLDWIAAGLVVVAMIVLKVFYIHSLKWHSDEPQHMHVVWGWASGRLPYRDVFDNHSPLFGFLFSFPFRLIGERNDIVDAMRWLMLPLFGLSLWCVYKLVAIADSPRTGLWAALVGGFFPMWFLKMGEFRTDVLWTTLWLVTLVILVTGRLSVTRLFFAGLALGATFSVSMKSPLMLITICASAGALWALRHFSGIPASEKLSAGKKAAMAGAALVGLLLIPAAFVTFFASKGILDKMYYCVILHNLEPGAHTAGRIFRRIFTGWYTLLVPLTLVAGWAALPLFQTDSYRASRRIFILCVTGLFCPILEGFWTHVTPQDYMPLWPLMGGAFVALLFMGISCIRVAPKITQIAGLVLVLGVIGVEAGYAIHTNPPNGLWNLLGMEAIKEARTLTSPNEFVMDPKGECIYRPRPYWYVLETLTRKRLFAGLDEEDNGKKMMPKLVDDIPQHLIDTHTAVAMPSTRMMEGTLKFVKDNYVEIGALRVLGKTITANESGVFAFDIAIPEKYVLVSRKGQLTGDLDGTPLNGPRELAPGHHEFRKTGGDGEVVVIWARAIEKGYSPFRRPALSESSLR